MPDDYVGLNLGDAGDDDAPACPDCGNPMEQTDFRVEAPNEAVAQRVFLAYHATMNIPLNVLAALAMHKVHLHIAPGDGADCDPDSKG